VDCSLSWGKLAKINIKIIITQTIASSKQCTHRAHRQRVLQTEAGEGRVQEPHAALPSAWLCPG